MALTSNLKRTGRAASAELAEQRSELADQQAEYANPNSSYWRNRFDKATEEFAHDSLLTGIWFSDLIPEKGTYRKHAELAEWLLKYKGVVPQVYWLPRKFAYFAVVPEGSDNTVSGQWKEHGYY